VVLESRTMLWKPLQFLIMSAVVVCNAIWHWTPNGLAAGVVGAGLAYVVTLVIVKVSDLCLGHTEARRRVRGLTLAICFIAGALVSGSAWADDYDDQVCAGTKKEAAVRTARGPVWVDSITQKIGTEVDCVMKEELGQGQIRGYMTCGTRLEPACLSLRCRRTWPKW
jgi:hypothetical protein